MNENKFKLHLTQVTQVVTQFTKFINQVFNKKVPVLRKTQCSHLFCFTTIF